MLAYIGFAMIGIAFIVVFVVKVCYLIYMIITCLKTYGDWEYYRDELIETIAIMFFAVAISFIIVGLSRG